jgi:hypothetical protein
MRLIFVVLLCSAFFQACTCVQMNPEEREAAHVRMLEMHAAHRIEGRGP